MGSLVNSGRRECIVANRHDTAGDQHIPTSGTVILKLVTLLATAKSGDTSGLLSLYC